MRRRRQLISLLMYTSETAVCLSVRLSGVSVHVSLVCSFSRELASVVSASAALISFQCIVPSCIPAPLTYTQSHLI